MDKGLPSYFRSCRKRHGLSQKQLAKILGHKTSYIISRVENGHREPCLHLVIAYSIIFDISVEELVPKIHGEIEYLLAKRICNNCYVFKNVNVRDKVVNRLKTVLLQ